MRREVFFVQFVHVDETTHPAILLSKAVSGGASYRQGEPTGLTIFVRVLPQALPRGPEAKKIKLKAPLK